MEERSYCAWVPPSEFAKCTHDEKQQRYDAKATKKLNRTVNTTQTQAATTVTTNDDTTQVSCVTTMPTIHEIMATQTHQGLPRGTYTNGDGRTFKTSALRTIRISNLSLDVNERLCLIDGGSNCGLAGDQMREYKYLWSESISLALQTVSKME